ncbi:Leucine-rich repeat [Sesbania bispinosa]|nr:Leucine-rich repeat [Sesbania bispinosa]
MMSVMLAKFLVTMFMVLLLLQLNLLLSNNVVFAQQVRCIEKERHALLELKAGLVLDDTDLLSSWESDDPKSDCCKWKGVMCSKQTGHVEILDLNGQDQPSPFRGEISESLTKLQHLKYLNLSWNQFIDNPPIPEFFGSLRNLRFLDLQGSLFGGRIPNNLANLSHLQYLDLSWNNLEGTIPHQLETLSHLEHLNLGGNYLVGAIPHQLGNLSHLQHLNLGMNYLAGTIPHQLGSLSNLQVLNLGSNNLGLKIHDKNYVGGEWLSNLTLLTHLDLSKVQNLNYSHSWLQVIGMLPKIEELVLSDCDLSDLWLSPLSHLTLNFSTSLAILDLSRNTFTSTMIFQWLFNASSNITELDLSYNNLEGPILYNFGNSRNPLEHLDLSGNDLHGGILESSKDICTLHSLQLDSINLNGDISTILLDLSGCARYSLQELSLSYNQITGTLPDIVVFPSLKVVDLSNNQLSGKVPEGDKLPSKLETLIIESNTLEGGIPRSFGNICTLVSLDMSHNRLSEDLSVIIHNLSAGCAKYSLQELRLASNRITGTIPDMSVFPSLDTLVLSNNLLSGIIPKSIQFPSQLKELYMDSNNLEGVISDSHFANTSMLKHVDLSYNSLALIFSENWTPPFQLVSIHLSSCRYSSYVVLAPDINTKVHEYFIQQPHRTTIANVEFPKQPILWKSSTKSVLLNKHSTVRSLSKQSIRENFEMHQQFYSNDSKGFLNHKCGAKQLFKNNELILRSIDLSSNQLMGDIPEEIGNLVELVSLNLSSNNLSGEITSKIGRLTSLEFLDLSRNHLFGSIPSSLTQIDRLSMLNLSNNNLSGRIPIGTQLQSFDASSYEGNADLCGKPLDKKCPGDEIAPQEPKTHDGSSQEDKNSIYLSVSLGFITGFWGLLGSVLLNRTWRHAYILFLNNIIDTTYVITVVNAAKFQRWLRGFSGNLFFLTHLPL